MVCFCWSGFPQYAARCVGAFVKRTQEEVVVVATRPRVPILGMERLCGCHVIWLEMGVSDILEIDARAVSVAIVSGWFNPAFNRFASRVKKMGGRVIAMVDNNFNFSFGEVIKAIRFRAFLRQKYDGFLVPGKSAKRLLMFYGVSERDIGTNLYSADSTIFANGMALSERLKRIVFVGQLCERKNVLTLLDAFVLSGIYKEGWTLSYFGSGPLRDELISRIAKQKMGNSVEVNAFKQPEQLAEEYRRSCGFVLPSVEEHWGLVVHEAALSGCLLLLSDCVGAAADLATERNAILFNPTVVSSIAKAFVKMTTFDNLRLKECQYESLRLARKISIGGFVESLQSLLEGQI